MSEWQPIETAPQTGAYILLCNHDAGASWIGKYLPIYISGYRPENPWSSMMLNHHHFKKKWASIVPTHWMPLPEPPHD